MLEYVKGMQTDISKELKSIDDEVKTCRVCFGVESFIHNTVSLGENCTMLFVGESPAKNGWVVTGKAFINPKGETVPSGKVLSRLLEILDTKLEDITFTEAVKCYVPDRKLLTACSVNCLDILHRQIAIVKPKVIVPLGEYPTRALIGQTVNFKRFGEVAGKKHIINIKGEEYIVFPIYHPSPISPKGYKGNVEIFDELKRIVGA